MQMSTQKAASMLVLVVWMLLIATGVMDTGDTTKTLGSTIMIAAFAVVLALPVNKD